MHSFAKQPILRSSVLLVAALCLLPGSPCRAQQPQPKPASADSSQQIVNRIVNSPLPVLIDFYAPWCGPCKLLSPMLLEIEKQYKGKITVMRVNIDIHRGIANYFRISSIPAVFLVKDKTAVKGITGLRPKDEYVKAIEEVLAMKVQPPEAQPSRQDSSGKVE